MFESLRKFESFEKLSNFFHFQTFKKIIETSKLIILRKKSFKSIHKRINNVHIDSFIEIQYWHLHSRISNFSLMIINFLLIQSMLLIFYFKFPSQFSITVSSEILRIYPTQKYHVILLSTQDIHNMRNGLKGEINDTMFTSLFSSSRVSCINLFSLFGKFVLNCMHKPSEMCDYVNCFSLKKLNNTNHECQFIKGAFDKICSLFVTTSSMTSCKQNQVRKQQNALLSCQ